METTSSRRYTAIASAVVFLGLISGAGRSAPAAEGGGTTGGTPSGSSVAHSAPSASASPAAVSSSHAAPAAAVPAQSTASSSSAEHADIAHPQSGANPPTGIQQTNTAADTTAKQEHREDRRDRHNANNLNGGYYVDTGWPFYNNGYGWDGNGNYNNGTTTTFQPAQNGSTPAPAPVAAPSQSDSSTVTSAGEQAQISNAVDKSPALTAANSRVQMAQTAYNAERERVLAALRKTPAYQQALARRKAAAQDVGAAKAGDKGTDSVVNAASAKLEAGDEVTKMEEDAVAADPTSAAAKGRLEQASVDRDGLRTQLTSQTQSTVH